MEEPIHNEKQEGSMKREDKQRKESRQHNMTKQSTQEDCGLVKVEVEEQEHCTDEVDVDENHSQYSDGACSAGYGDDSDEGGVKMMTRMTTMVLMSILMFAGLENLLLSLIQEL